MAVSLSLAQMCGYLSQHGRRVTYGGFRTEYFLEDSLLPSMLELVRDSKRLVKKWEQRRQRQTN